MSCLGMSRRKAFSSVKMMYTAGSVSMSRSLHKRADCMQFGARKQMLQAVKEFTSRPLPFENGGFWRKDEFRGLPARSAEETTNTTVVVLQDFAGSPFKVRRACTIERKIVLQCEKKRLGVIKKEEP